MGKSNLFGTPDGLAKRVVCDLILFKIYLTFNDKSN